MSVTWNRAKSAVAIDNKAHSIRVTFVSIRSMLGYGIDVV